MSSFAIWFQGYLIDLWYFMTRIAILIQANGQLNTGKKWSVFKTPDEFNQQFDNPAVFWK